MELDLTYSPLRLDLPYKKDRKKEGLCVSEPLHFATQCLKDVFETLCWINLYVPETLPGIYYANA